MCKLKKGVELYHINIPGKGIVKEVIGDNIIIEFDENLTEYTSIKLPKSHIGTWIFFDKTHLNFSVEELARMKEYSEGAEIIKYSINNDENIKSKKSESNNEEVAATLIYSPTIEDILKKRNIKHLVHFTRIENLESILINGFIPVSDPDFIKRGCTRNDYSRYDGKTGCTCFSIEQTNKELLYKYMQNYPNSKWVVILVDAKVLIEHDNDKYYCCHNAATRSISNQLYNEKLKSTRDFENMFSGEVSYVSSTRGREVLVRSSMQKDCYPTSSQAEILIRGKISKEYIKSINFRNSSDHRYFINTIKFETLLNKYKLILDRNYF